MVTSLESRLWLAVHLLYSNASQAFDVYQAVVLQSEHSIAKQDTQTVFTRLVQVYDKIPAIGSSLAFYEFEFEEIDQWKIIYKNSQKTQLIIFVGVLIFELKINDIAATVKLASEKAQFLFHQIFKKLASTSQKLKYNEQLEFKKQNDNKISYLFTYENLVDYCLGLLTTEEAEKVENGLKIYPMLQIAKEEYSRIISQIQNLKVQKERAIVSSEDKPNLKIVNNQVTSAQYTSKGFTKMQMRLMVGFGAVLLGALLIQPLSLLKKFSNRDNSILLHTVDKSADNLAKNSKPETTAPFAANAASSTSATAAVASADQQNPKPAPTPAATAIAANPAPTPETVAKNDEAAGKSDEKSADQGSTDANAEGGLYRGTLFVADLNASNTQIKDRITTLGAIKAGEVELGWLKSPNLAYYHYTIPVKNMAEAESYLKQMGRLQIKFEKHPRKVPAGSRRFIIEVKQN